MQHFKAEARIFWQGEHYTADLRRPISIALPLKPHPSSVRAWNAPPIAMQPVRVGDWVGAVAQGAPVNFMTLHINPHGNGTHTETLGHIARDWASNTVLGLLHPGYFVGILHHAPTNVLDNGDRVVDLSGLRQNPPQTPGLIIRVVDGQGADQNFSDTNPPYFLSEDLAWMAALGIQHLITDLPSVDRELDGGVLAGHHAFWQYPASPRTEATITELAKLNQGLTEGLYLVTLNALPLAMDASPSHPLLYPLQRSTTS